MDSLYAQAEDLAEHVDGAIEQHRLVSHVGADRSRAMGSEGRDQVISLVSEQELVTQIAGHLEALVERHAEGPSGFLWVVLRKSGKAGNLACTAPIRVGGATAAEATLEQQALARAVAMGPQTLDTMRALLQESMRHQRETLESERELAVVLAQMHGAAEAGDEGARWQAMADAAQHLSPVLRTAVQAWMASQGASAGPEPEDMDAEDLADVLRRASPEAREAVVRSILAEVGIDLDDLRQGGPAPQDGEA